MGWSWKDLERSDPGAATSWLGLHSHVENGDIYPPCQVVVGVRDNMLKLLT